MGFLLIPDVVNWQPRIAITTIQIHCQVPCKPSLVASRFHSGPLWRVASDHNGDGRGFSLSAALLPLPSTIVTSFLIPSSPFRPLESPRSFHESICCHRFYLGDWQYWRRTIPSLFDVVSSFSFLKFPLTQRFHKLSHLTQVSVSVLFRWTGEVPKDHLTCPNCVKSTHCRRDYAYERLLSSVSILPYTLFLCIHHKHVQLTAKLQKKKILSWERGIPEKDDALCVPLAYNGDFLAQFFLVSLVVLQHSAVSRMRVVAECWKSTQERETAEGPGRLSGFQTPISGKHIS